MFDSILLRVGRAAIVVVFVAYPSVALSRPGLVAAFKVQQDSSALRPAAAREIATPIPCPVTQSGDEAFVGVTAPSDSNFSNDDGDAVLGGQGNQSCASFSAIGAGANNRISAAGVVSDGAASFSFIGAGTANYAESSNELIGAGQNNVIAGDSSFIGAGYTNTVGANGSSIVGGINNRITTPGTYSVIGGGTGNYVDYLYGTIGGGGNNFVEGAFATIPGGADNDAFGTASFAAGYHAFADHSGSFVWSDDVSGSSLVEDSASNQFVIRASGGTFVYSSENLMSGVELAAGSGTWSSLSDRNAKTDIVPLDDAAVLAKVAALPISAWQYKTEPGVRHVGPMAQDFFSAFNVGNDDRRITSIDEDGVALAAIKALESENVALQSRLETSAASKNAAVSELREKNADLRSSFSRLEAEFDAFAKAEKERSTEVAGARSATNGTRHGVGRLKGNNRAS